MSLSNESGLTTPGPVSKAKDAGTLEKKIERRLREALECDVPCS